LRHPLPNLRWNASCIWELTSSLPFETVNWVTSRTAMAAVSETVHGAGVVPSAAYSAGSSVGLVVVTSWMRALIPAT